MDDSVLPPERFHALQVSLDRLRASTEACRRALCDLADGAASEREFASRLEAYREAHRAWLDENETYLRVR